MPEALRAAVVTVSDSVFRGQRRDGSGPAVTEFLQLLTDFMGERGDITRLNFDPMDGTVRRGQTASREQCVCKDSKGFGDLRSLHTLPDLSHLEDQAARDSVLGRRSIPKKR